MMHRWYGTFININECVTYICKFIHVSVWLLLPKSPNARTSQLPDHPQLKCIHKMLHHRHHSTWKWNDDDDNAGHHTFASTNMESTDDVSQCTRHQLEIKSILNMYTFHRFQTNPIKLSTNTHTRTHALIATRDREIVCFCTNNTPVAHMLILFSLLLLLRPLWHCVILFISFVTQNSVWATLWGTNKRQP